MTKKAKLKTSLENEANMENPVNSLNNLFKEVYAFRLRNLFCEKWTIDQWLTVVITEDDIKDFPNAKEAHRIQNSKLYKSLK